MNRMINKCLMLTDNAGNVTQGSALLWGEDESGTQKEPRAPQPLGALMIIEATRSAVVGAISRFVVGAEGPVCGIQGTHPHVSHQIFLGHINAMVCVQLVE